MVKYEDKDSLSKLYKEKVNKYIDAASYIKARLNVTKEVIVPTAVRCRGQNPWVQSKRCPDGFNDCSSVIN